MNVLQKHRYLLARLQLALFLGMLVYGVVFRHSHRLADGTIISHAHPYKPFNKGPFQPNTHTQQELIWLDYVSHIPFTNSEIDVLIFLALQTVVALLLFPPIQFIHHTYLHYFHRRGPPVAL